MKTKITNSKKYYISPTSGEEWSIRFGTEEQYDIVKIFRAKSRSKVEMQYLLNHVNKQLKNEN